MPSSEQKEYSDYNKITDTIIFITLCALNSAQTCVEKLISDLPLWQGVRAEFVMREIGKLFLLVAQLVITKEVIYHHFMTYHIM